MSREDDDDDGHAEGVDDDGVNGDGVNGEASGPPRKVLLSRKAAVRAREVLQPINRYTPRKSRKGPQEDASNKSYRQYILPSHLQELNEAADEERRHLRNICPSRLKYCEICRKNVSHLYIHHVEMHAKFKEILQCLEPSCLKWLNARRGDLFRHMMNVHRWSHERTLTLYLTDALYCSIPRYAWVEYKRTKSMPPELIDIPEIPELVDDSVIYIEDEDTQVGADGYEVEVPCSSRASDLPESQTTAIDLVTEDSSVIITDSVIDIERSTVSPEHAAASLEDTEINREVTIVNPQLHEPVINVDEVDYNGLITASNQSTPCHRSTSSDSGLCTCSRSREESEDTQMPTPQYDLVTRAKTPDGLRVGTVEHSGTTDCTGTVNCNRARDCTGTTGHTGNVDRARIESEESDRCSDCLCVDCQCMWSPVRHPESFDHDRPELLNQNNPRQFTSDGPELLFELCSHGNKDTQCSEQSLELRAQSSHDPLSRFPLDLRSPLNIMKLSNHDNISCESKVSASFVSRPYTPLMISPHDIPHVATPGQLMEREEPAHIIQAREHCHYISSLVTNYAQFDWTQASDQQLLVSVEALELNLKQMEDIRLAWAEKIGSTKERLSIARRTLANRHSVSMAHRTLMARRSIFQHEASFTTGLGWQNSETTHDTYEIIDLSKTETPELQDQTSDDSMRFNNDHMHIDDGVVANDDVISIRDYCELANDDHVTTNEDGIETNDGGIVSNDAAMNDNHVAMNQGTVQSPSKDNSSEKVERMPEGHMGEPGTDDNFVREVIHCIDCPRVGIEQITCLPVTGVGLVTDPSHVVVEDDNHENDPPCVVELPVLSPWSQEATDVTVVTEPPPVCIEDRVVLGEDNSDTQKSSVNNYENLPSVQEDKSPSESSQTVVSNAKCINENEKQTMILENELSAVLEKSVVEARSDSLANSSTNNNKDAANAGRGDSSNTSGDAPNASISGGTLSSHSGAPNTSGDASNACRDTLGTDGDTLNQINDDDDTNINNDSSNTNSDSSNTNSDSSNTNSDSSNTNSDSSNTNSDSSNTNSDSSNTNSDSSNTNKDVSNLDVPDTNGDISYQNIDVSNLDVPDANGDISYLNEYTSNLDTSNVSNLSEETAYITCPLLDDLVDMPVVTDRKETAYITCPLIDDLVDMPVVTDQDIDHQTRRLSCLSIDDFLSLDCDQLHVDECGGSSQQDEPLYKHAKASLLHVVYYTGAVVIETRLIVGLPLM